MSNSFVRALPCVGYSLAGVNTLGGFKVEEISSQSLLAHFLGKCSNTFLIPNICKVECAKNMVIFSSPPPRRGGEGGEGAALALRPGFVVLPFSDYAPASPLPRPAVSPWPRSVVVVVRLLHKS